MIASRTSTVFAIVRPPARCLSRRLLDRQFSPHPPTFVSPAGERWISSRRRRRQGLNAASLRRQALASERNQYQDLNDESFHANVYDQDAGGQIALRDGRHDDDDGDIDAIIAELEQAGKDGAAPTKMDEGEMRQAMEFLPNISALENEGKDPASIVSSSNLFAHHVQSHRVLPRQLEISLDKFNEILDDASLRPHNEAVRRQVWRWYARCRHSIPDFVKMIPSECWSLLWSTQALESDGNRERVRHLKILSDDKQDAGWELNLTERLAQIEGLFLADSIADALAQWQALDEGVNSANEEYLTIGIRIFALSGDFTEAESVTKRLFDVNPNTDPRVILSLINGICRLGSAENVDRCWFWYEEFRSKMGASMQISDFDDISNAFLAANHSRAALAVFRDMMLDSEKAHIDTNMSLTRRFSNFIRGETQADKINETALNMMQFLPNKFNNKFFFGSWIKKLIGEGELTAAAKVIDLMYEFHIMPDARYLNGLIGAWLREDTEESKMKAEKLGWSMIKSRVDHVKKRKCSEETLELLDPTESAKVFLQGKFTPLFISRPVPAGTTETWSILADFYSRSNMLDNVRRLRDLLVTAELPLTSFFMNVLLRAERHYRGYQRVWSRFEVMTRSTKPDVDSWQVVWECASVHVERMAHESSNFPLPRALFCSMMQWLDGLSDGELKRARRDFDTDVLNVVVRALCQMRDLNGLFVALHTLYERLGVTSDSTTAHSIIALVARLDAPLEIIRRRRDDSNKWAMNIEKSGRALESIHQARREQVESDGYDYLKDLTPRQKLVDSHKALLTFLHAVIEQREGVNHIHAAAADMQAGRIDAEHAMGYHGVLDCDD